MAPTVAPNPTRQQLDELDDLLQKMLTLPISQIDEAMAKPAPRPIPKPAPPPPAYTPPIMQAPPPPKYSAPVAKPVEPTPPPSKPAGGWSIDLNPKQGSSVLGDRSPLAEPARKPEPVEPPPTDIGPPLKVSMIAASVEPKARRSPALPIRTLVAINRGFDTFATAMGPTGSLFAGPLRNVLGVGGLAMLAGSLAWTAGWLR